GTRVMSEWVKLKRRNPDAKLVCLDIAPYANTPAHERPDVLNIGGFSDVTFDLIADFARDRLGRDHWAGEIAKVRL
ncbi:MAG: RNA-binding protein, partial [Hyphomicrobiaceae bacterium]